jgi:flavodoxin
MRTDVKVLMVFFSGTGDTQFVSEHIKDHVLDACSFSNREITLTALEWSSPPSSIGGYDLVCLGFPVYKGGAPKNVRDFIDRLPGVQDKGAFVFNTSCIRFLERRWRRGCARRKRAPAAGCARGYALPVTSGWAKGGFPSTTGAFSAYAASTTAPRKRFRSESFPSARRAGTAPAAGTSPCAIKPRRLFCPG